MSIKKVTAHPLNCLRVLGCSTILSLTACTQEADSPDTTTHAQETSTVASQKASDPNMAHKQHDDSSSTAFQSDVDFLQKHVDTIVLKAKGSDAEVAVVGDWQGRVMTATSGSGKSFGWLNRELIHEGIKPEGQREGLTKHIYALGGADRFWIGPEGGQFSWYFSPSDTFEFSNWKVPAFIDTEAWSVTENTGDSVTFRHTEQLKNWAGFDFKMEIEREVALLSRKETSQAIGFDLPKPLSFVSYETRNKMSNDGDHAWTAETGMPSVWILGMLNHGDRTSVIIPFAKDAGDKPVVKDDYFGKVPSERLRVDQDTGVIHFSADGKYRSKIGVNHERSLGVAGSWDAVNEVLTIVQYNQPEGPAQYVNSAWEKQSEPFIGDAMQSEPFIGDAINSYNDGPVDDGSMLGPFYEIETSSPALALQPGESYTHIHRTIHIEGDRDALNALAKTVFGVELSNIEQGLSSAHDQSAEISFSIKQADGITPNSDFSRRDPSDVILHDGKYYVWYSKTAVGVSTGYDASIWYASSPDGVSWKEEGEALARGSKGAWDHSSVFTPNILKANDKFYLYYTGVGPTAGNPDGIFENNSTTDKAFINIAVADNPNGPFVRVSAEPILSPSENFDDFDSFRIDDSAVVARENGYWLYYKGRSAKYGRSGPHHTKMGVAIAASPEGPYKKYSGNPITKGGHEVIVWPANGGVMSFLSNHGEEGRTLQFAEDGKNFSIVGKVSGDYPFAPGLFRSDDFAATGSVGDWFWGISMRPVDAETGNRHSLNRYEAVIKK